MKIVITKIIVGAPDHFTPKTYDVGQVHEVGTQDMPEFLAQTLLSEGYAEEVTKKETSAAEVLATLTEESVETRSKPAGYPKRYEKKA